MNSLLPVSATLWKQRYESLRQHVLERRQVLASEPLGLIVVVTRGLASWMQTWWEAADDSPVPLASLPPPCHPSTPSWQQQLTDLLAHMTAQHL
jgi:hypothetical protein